MSSVWNRLSLIHSGEEEEEEEDSFLSISFHPSRKSSASIVDSTSKVVYVQKLGN